MKFTNNGTEFEIIDMNGKYALLASDNNYIVASGFNIETKDWSHGTYYSHFGNNKAQYLLDATDHFLARTNDGYISRSRLEEIATKAIDDLFYYADEDDAYETLEDEIQMEEMELMYFERVRKLDDYDENWEYGDSDDEFTVIVNGEELKCEMTINPAVPDRYCNRVEIDGKYYYFS